MVQSVPVRCCIGSLLEVVSYSGAISACGLQRWLALESSYSTAIDAREMQSSPEVIACSGFTLLLKRSVQLPLLGSLRNIIIAGFLSTTGCGLSGSRLQLIQVMASPEMDCMMPGP